MAVTTPSSLPAVGTQVNPPGIKIFSCNGVRTSKQKAIVHACMISYAFGGREVTVFHNPTSSWDLISPSNSEAERQRNLAADLAVHIHNFITDQQEAGIDYNDIRILVFAHSHGAVVTESSLTTLEETDREKVDVYTFGGATMIANNLANRVFNYVHKDDRIANIGNFFSNDNLMLITAKRILYKANENGENLLGAIYEQAKIDTFWKLQPINWEGDKKSRYQAIFKQKSQAALESDSFFLERLQIYLTYFNTHTIFLQSPPEVGSASTSAHTSGNENSWLKNGIQLATSLGVELLKNHHFASYARITWHIAGFYPQAPDN